MLAAVKIASEIITGSTYEQAYIKGCKRFASFMNGETITLKIEKIPVEKGDEIRKVKFSFYTNLDMAEFQKHYCKVCKEFHCNFYINEEYNCSRCNLKSYLSRLRSATTVSKTHCRHKLYE